MLKHILITCLIVLFLPLFFIVSPPVQAVSNFTANDGNMYDDGQPIMIKGINWFGFETSNHVVHGLWSRNWQDMVDQMKGLGFNALRIPFCPQTLDGVGVDSIDYSKNADLQGKNSLQILDGLLGYLNDQQMYFILDSHRPDCYGQSPLWYTDSYSEQEWQDDLVFVADRYKNLDYFLGVDLKNEPHGATWGTGNASTDWNTAAEKAGQAILSTNPNVLIFIAGITENPSCSSNTNSFWGENIEPQVCYPISTDFIPANKQVFIPHVYGPDVYNQPYFSDPNFPNNMPQIWDTHFGFARDDGLTLAIGEWGGKYGHGGDPKDTIWQDAFSQYLQDRQICHSFYWSWNPNSGDTGGILQDDWQTPWSDKVAMLNDYYAGCSVDGGGQVFCDADLDMDGSVNLVDYSILARNFFADNPDNDRVDINQDGSVNIKDYTLLVGAFFTICQ